MELIRRLEIAPGAVFDLGSGIGAIRDPLVSAGFEYIASDIDDGSLAALRERGIEAHHLDLRQAEALPAAVQVIVGERQIAAVLLLDVLEHLPDPGAALAAIRRTLEFIGHPPLILSAPNVTHVDLGAKLVFGRWDYTRTGLLDDTHLQFFGAERLRAETLRAGLHEVAAHDVESPTSDQHFPAVHPALSSASPVAQLIRSWRDSVDPHGTTIQFVRAFLAAGGSPTRQSPESGPGPAPTLPLTVVMRTQGRRDLSLMEALTCLAAQTVDTFDVHVVVHAAEPAAAVSAVEALVHTFDPTFSSRVRVISASGGRRARPLNAALQSLSAEYVAFLDDDDLVTADWVETFITHASEGAIVRSMSAVRQVSDPPPELADAVPPLADSQLEFCYENEFDPVLHQWGNHTPICSIAIPSYLVDMGIRFDDELPVLEDWDFLLKCVSLAPVRDTGAITSIYQMRRTGDSSASVHDAALWRATQHIVQDRSNLRPLLLPAGSTARIVALFEAAASHDAAVAHLQGELQTLAETAVRREEELDRVRVELSELRDEHMLTIRSRRWRIMAPAARAAAIMRRVTKHAR